jgi:hypothetical protein
MSTINLSGIKIQADYFGELSPEEEKEALINSINIALSKNESQPQIMNADEVTVEIGQDEDEESGLDDDYACPQCSSADLNDCGYDEREDCHRFRCKNCNYESWSYHFLREEDI